ncbi:MAG: tRNA pseudouridine(13) synthase TruD [Gemmataceae bacterium]
MKLKQQPEDFEVEELVRDLELGWGPYAVYELEKKSLGTLEAIEEVARHWRLAPGRIAYGGLKDRHAWTRQHVTIYRGPRTDACLPGVRMRYLGQRQKPLSSRDLLGNRFRIVVRDLTASDVACAEQELDVVRREGVANYFDQQRFGSVTSQGEFVAKAMIQGDYERALWLALAAPYQFDRAAQKTQKRLVRRLWGQWPLLKDSLPRGSVRSLVTYLADHPQDYRGALQRMRPEWLSLYLAAYQSYLWNELLAEYLRTHLVPERLIAMPLRTGTIVFFRGLDENERQVLHQVALPLPSARLRLPEADPLAALVERVLAREGLTLRQMKLKHFRRPFFSRGQRAAVFVPHDLTWHAGADLLNPGRRALTLQCVLAPGSYATMLIKRVQAVCFGAQHGS